MRPKKIIVVWSLSEMTRSLLRLVLETRGYAACAVASEAEIYPLAATAHVCLLVGIPQLARLACETKLHTEHRGCVPVSFADCCRQDRGIWTAELLDTVKRATFRKRGPKSPPEYKNAYASATGAAARSQATATKYFEGASA